MDRGTTADVRDRPKLGARTPPPAVLPTIYRIERFPQAAPVLNLVSRGGDGHAMDQPATLILDRCGTID